MEILLILKSSNSPWKLPLSVKPLAFCSCIESVGGGVTGSWAGVVVEAVAREGNQPRSRVGEGYVAWAGR